MTERMILENDEFFVEIEERGRKYHKGARDSLGGKAGMGPPLEPDEVEIGYSIKRVSLFDMDITSNFDTDMVSDEENLYEEIERSFKEMFREDA